MVGLKISTLADKAAGLAVVRLSGDMDSLTVSDLDVTLNKLYGDSFTRIIVDLGNLKYANSAGIGAFVKITKKVREKRGDIVFIHVTKKILDIFRSLGLDNVFRIFTDEKAARAFFGESAPAGEKRRSP